MGGDTRQHDPTIARSRGRWLRPDARCNPSRKQTWQDQERQVDADVDPEKAPDGMESFA
jgi:hypothetical protein